MRTPRSLEPLTHRGFRLLAGGQLASNVGDAAYAVALPWYVLADHGGAILLGIVLAAYGIPRTALVALGGHASDRWRPWTVIMGADAVRVLAVGALAALAATGPAHAALLIPVAAVLGAGEGMFLPASFAIVPSLLSDDQLQAGNALTFGGTQLAALIGPGIGGAVVALLGPSPAFGIGAVSFAVSAATLARVRRRQRPLPATATEAVPRAATVAHPIGTHTTGQVGTKPVTLGVSHRGRLPRRRPVPRRGHPAAGALAAYGELNGFGNIIAITAFQRWAPPGILGRLMGLLLLASFGIFPVSVLLGGLVVRDLGASAFFLLAAAILTIAVLAGLTQPTWRAFGSDTTARAETTPTHPAEEAAG